MRDIGDHLKRTVKNLHEKFLILIAHQSQSPKNVLCLFYILCNHIDIEEIVQLLCINNEFYTH